MHPRRAIREAFKTRLATALPSVRVVESRITPWEATRLPALSVRTNTEQTQELDTAPRELQRVVDVELVITVEAVDDVDDVLDEMTLAMEAAVDIDNTFGGLCQARLTGTEIGLVAEGRKPMGQAVLTYSAEYYTDAPVNPAVLDDLKTVATTYQPSDGVEDTVPAEDKQENLDEA